MNIHLHQTHHVIADFSGVYSYLEKHFSTKKKEGIHIFPELFLTGYPLQDLCLTKPFIQNHTELLEKLNQFFNSLNPSNKILILAGGLHYQLTPEGLPEKIYNVVYQIILGENIKPIATKILLPNYDIFDEKKYFTPATGPSILTWNNLNLGILICEDMWPSSGYNTDPVADLLNSNTKLDAIINLSASPYHLHKFEKRTKRACEISHLLRAPFIYVNKVGFEDEILFDGRSFIACGDNVIHTCNLFSSDYHTTTLPSYKPKTTQNTVSKVSTTWESLFAANLVKQDHHLPVVRPLDTSTCEEIIKALGFAIQEYAAKCGFCKFSVALSGGLDSALVLTILKLAMKDHQSIEAVYMPSEFSQNLSHDLSHKLCHNLNIPFHVFPIKEIHQSCRELFIENFNMPLAHLSDENIQSRMRAMLIMARANQLNSIVINTSNKSELAVGYSTIYGDSIGALSLLGDIYKSEVYMLAKHINQHHKNIIPEGIIDRPPTAELRENQQDVDSLPPYDRLDAILEGILSYRLTVDDLNHLGFDKEEVEKVFRLYAQSEYKRKQFCPIVKIQSKSFGFGYRIPICKNNNLYFSLNQRA